jgi:isoleucyl-tRNA synthetase
MPEVKKALETADGDALAAELERNGRLTIMISGGSAELSTDEVEVRLVERPGTATQGDRELLVALETALTPELVAEGLAREFVHWVQQERKKLELDYADRIRVGFAADAATKEAVDAHLEWIKGETLAVAIEGAVAQPAALTVEKV